jgi:hypothetical protein
LSYRKPENKILLETREEEKARQERERQAKDAAIDKCWAACEAGDVSTIKELYQTGLLPNLVAIMAGACNEGWLVATRCLLELGADPNEMPTFSLSACRSLDMFKLLAEFGMDLKLEGNNIVE